MLKINVNIGIEFNYFKMLRCCPYRARVDSCEKVWLQTSLLELPLENKNIEAGNFHSILVSLN